MFKLMGVSISMSVRCAISRQASRANEGAFCQELVTVLVLVLRVPVRRFPGYPTKIFRKNTQLIIILKLPVWMIFPGATSPTTNPGGDRITNIVLTHPSYPRGKAR